MSKRSTGRVSITDSRCCFQSTRYKEVLKSSHSKSKNKRKSPDAGIMKEAEKTFSKLKCSNNQTQNAFPSSAVNFFTTRRDIYPRKTNQKSKKIYQSHSFEARTGALHEHLQSRWSQKNSSHLDFVEEQKKKDRASQSQSFARTHTHSCSLSLSLSLSHSETDWLLLSENRLRTAWCLDCGSRTVRYAEKTCPFWSGVINKGQIPTRLSGAYLHDPSESK